MKNRLIDLRNVLKLNQRVFAEKIGLKQPSYAQLESGTREINERHIKLICQEFNVSEEWLRFGNGEMFVQSDNSLLTELEHEFKLNQFTRHIVMEYIRMPDDMKKAFETYLQNVVEKYRSENK